WQQSAETIASQAQNLGRRQTEQADLVLVCWEADQVSTESGTSLDQSSAIAIATKCDLAAPPADMLATSAVSGAGLAELRRLIANRARAWKQPALAPSLSRCHGHVTACLDHLRRGHELVLFDESPELLAVEVRAALEQLGEMVGAVYTDDLLDRIFSRFCIG